MSRSVGGLFSYYEDSGQKDEKPQRKSIALHANNITCRPVKLQHKTLGNAPSGACFEITVEGGPKRLWIAKNRQERQGWISAINDAMIGGSRTRGDTFVEYNVGKNKGAIPKKSPYRKDLKRYVRVQTAIKESTTKSSYLHAVSDLLGESINVPVPWIRAQIEEANPTSGEEAFLEEEMAVGINQLWKDIRRDTVRINGETFVGDSGHGVEQIIGALTRSILHHDRSYSSTDGSDRDTKATHINESQALSYARDVLLSSNRTRSGGDSYYCMDTLCSHPELVVLCPASTDAQPLTLTVTHAKLSDQPTKSTKSGGKSEMTGWVKTRIRNHRSWKKNFLVLSDGKLCIYERAPPEPHDLKARIELGGAKLEVNRDKSSKKHVGRFFPNRNDDEDGTDMMTILISAGNKCKERELGFEDEQSFQTWSEELRIAARQVEKSSHPTSSSTKASARALSTVEIWIQASTAYKICTRDPDGDESIDTWVYLTTNFLQKFRLSGGPLGRIIRGEELVQLTFLDPGAKTDAGSSNH
eukprot:CAMPEP_0118674328 /NCGR_PEP_ID=MMETSP0800-20121206/828_1 /TAXON_ID=210618 ORGANISM="Striatella unipunctata, Strain CCMP2910" /NCGR_SAMPLE_ID=MMETSP0800 /ASSEMBLY_ACC=CAM_ASM_000638 /LENGTH=527 /DNA_ID=CAMNT_0006569513 /DNA_START=113 /DNA_END=1695 /DNA_ORIENTATION=+